MEEPQVENQATTAETPVDLGTGSEPKRAVFPHDLQAEHWEVDFSNSKEVYEGMALPLWILAGWAIFIIWAVVYLIAGARTVF